MAGTAQIVTPGVTTLEQPKIKIENLRKTYEVRGGEVIALNDANLDIMPNEFISVVGPSGCGKTTLLNIIAGLEKATSGRVEVDGKLVTEPGKDRGVVFQQYALFPWKTVIKNIEFGLKLRGYNKAERREKAEQYLEYVNLKDFAHAYPKELSGGMKQRVAIARAYAVQPEVLLMDEPFGALDAQTRAQLQEDLLKTWQTEKKTCFFITHDVEEAVILAQRVVIMSARPVESRKLSMWIFRIHGIKRRRWIRNLSQSRMRFGLKYTRSIWKYKNKKCQGGMGCL
ncbi:ABC transporter ATP-binding protein [Paenibacillus pini]|uniref:Carnitine transport ATP-binding protein OpuCA n=1 Tax=Paenibacillus pini JCM 16418 TaxID=1236976 RepID=W7YUC2_9BACL|nr:ABC transporter ATP-binding protein [Paenibacillus pini]GAF08166.1 ABC-type nitrate/sulfonate/bicarbonate transport system [Paenibacillus pini JCM 16418]